ncbi:MAG: SOS response-associated peptidase [Pirellulales bacterium]
MCGRFTLRTPLARVAELFDAVAIGDWAKRQPPRYNIAPSQIVAAVRSNTAGDGRELVPLAWGLVPSWSDDAAIGNKMINARAETLATKPAFRDAFRKRRCLVIADGFYEWQKRGGAKQPYFIHMREDQPFAFAGLWARSERFETPIETCTIVTTEANALLRSMHDRMPVILDREACERWLDANVEDTAALEPLLRPHAADPMAAYPVSTLVNSPRHDAADCIEAAPSAPRQGSLFD